MTMLVVGIVLIVGGLAFAVYPFIRRQEPDETERAPGEPAIRPVPVRPATTNQGSVDPAVDPLAAEREELALDRAMGKLSDEDYARLLAALETRGRVASGASRSGIAAGGGAQRDVAAADAPRNAAPPDPAASPAAPSAETTPAATPLPDMPSTPAATATKRPLDDEAERLVQAERATVANCPSCGPRPEPGARFCSSCGAAIGGCPRCGAEVLVATARFCDQCGGALRA